jgi:hypothetical protein
LMKTLLIFCCTKFSTDYREKTIQNIEKLP